MGYAFTLFGREEFAKEIYGVNNTGEGRTVCRNLVPYNISS